MDFTAEQYAIMEMLSDRLIWDDLRAAEKDILLYLDKEGIAEPRAYKEEGLYVLSEKGKRVLAAHHALLESREQEAQEKARRESEEKRQQSFDNKISVLNLLMPLITFILGLLAEHFVGILDFLVALFD